MRSSPLLPSISALTCGLALLLPLAATRAADDTITHKPFGQTKSGTPVDIYTLTNKSGAEARITNYGGIVVSVKVPDKSGKLDDVVLGFDNLSGYEENPGPHFGELIGRYGNRIAQGEFKLDGHEYHLPINDPPNTLHGGKRGFGRYVWDAREGESTEGPTLTLNMTSPDGDQGFPGEVKVQAVYTLTEDNALKVAFEATTTRPTVINLTNHSYFDLRGQGRSGTILDHVATIYGSKFLPVDKTSIPLGELRPVDGTAFDFTHPTAIGAHINDQNPQLHLGPGGYDHCYVLDGYNARAGSSAAPFLAVHVSEPTTGRTLELWTAEPGVQFYSGNYLDGTFAGKGGRKYAKSEGFALEPQHYPDSPNRPEWPTTTLKPGETYHNTFWYKFGVQP